MAHFAPSILLKGLYFARRKEILSHMIFFVFYLFIYLFIYLVMLRQLDTFLDIFLFRFWYIHLCIHLIIYIFIKEKLILYSLTSFLQLIKSFDFEFGFCIPGSVNTWDAVYSLPAMSEKLSTYLLKFWIMILNSKFYHIFILCALDTFISLFLYFSFTFHMLWFELIFRFQ